MFKKIIVSLLLALTPLMLSNTFALEFIGVGSISLEQSSNNEPFPTLNIKATSDAEITKAHGISIMIPEGLAIQWDLDNNKNITVSGSAADKIITPVVPVISEDLYTINIAVKEDFKKDDEVKLNGLTPVTFKKQVSERQLSIDINGDNLSDAQDFFYFGVKDTPRTDGIRPQNATQLKAVYNKDLNRMDISWENPKNYDFIRTAVVKKIGSAEIELYSGTGSKAIDTNITKGETLTYLFFTNDEEGNVSEKNTIVVKAEEEKEVVAPEPVEEKPVEEKPTEPETPDPTTNETEKEELNRLFGYFRIRYQIKCLRENVSPKDSPCLWAKINLLYAQEKLNRNEVSLNLSNEDLELIGKRIVWPEMRYETNCVKAATKADNCVALKEAIDQVHYFLDKGEEIEINKSATLEVSNPNFKLPFGIHQNQVLKYFKWNDRYFATILQPSFNINLQVPSDFTVSYVGLLEGSDATKEWKEYLKVKNDDQNDENNPYYLWETQGSLNLGVVDVNGAGSGEGNLTVFEKNNLDEWVKVGCYYFSPTNSEALKSASLLSKHKLQALSKCDVDLRKAN